MATRGLAAADGVLVPGGGALSGVTAAVINASRTRCGPIRDGGDARRTVCPDCTSIDVLPHSNRDPQHLLSGYNNTSDPAVARAINRLMEAYLSLFTVSFLAATLLPAYSEVVFAGLLAAGYDPWTLWAWATAGNTLGAAVNWLLGRFLLHYQDRSWFPFHQSRLGRAQDWFQRYGVWSLLLAWAPVAGDALTFIAGFMKVHFAAFLVLTGIGKGVRYAILLGLVTLVGGTPVSS